MKGPLELDEEVDEVLKFMPAEGEDDGKGLSLVAVEAE
jgi:hypothetical protein